MKCSFPKILAVQERLLSVEFLGILEMKARILLMEVPSCSKRFPPIVDDDRESHSFNVEKEFS